MPGLLGLVTSRAGSDVRNAFHAMSGAMSRGDRLTSETLVDSSGRWALGRVHLGTLQPGNQLGTAHPIQVLFHGDLDNADELAAGLRREGVESGDTAASILRALYTRHGRASAARLKGGFTAAVLDTANDELVLISDRLGMYPLYWFTNEHRLVFASELRAALKAHSRPTIDARAVADFMKFSFPMGDRTLAAGVSLVPQSATLLYQARTGRVSIEPYGSVAQLFQPDANATDKPAYMESVRHAFDHAMTHATAGRHRLAISLSGGLDTRVILSALDRMGMTDGIHTFTLGGRGCADEVIGDELAKMARTRHRFDALDDHYLDDLLPSTSEMMTLTDGMYVSHGFTEALALSGFLATDATLLLRGHCGEMLKASTAWPFHTDAHVFGLRTSDELVTYLMSRVSHVSRGDAARDVLSPPLAEALNGANAETSLRECLAGVELSPPDLCSYIYLKEYTRRVTIASLEIFRSALDVRLPFADVDFLTAVLRGPARWRDGVQIHQALIAANGPAYLRVRNPNTGAPAGAGPAAEWVLDKVNTIFRRLNVYGYRHYHSFDGWMRKALLSLVDRVLLAPDALGQGLFREAAVRERVRQAHSGSTEHDDLLQALVLVQLWQAQLR